MVMNRLGDIGIVLAIAFIYIEYKSFDFTIISGLSSLLSNDFVYFCDYYINSMTLISFFIFIGAVGKSAQIGLHTWLPDAMAGPTPVSALIHAATMVTAGVFALVRLSPIMENAPNTLIIISFIGVLTSFFSATIGLFQNDLKKIIAYSTCSQLGYMVFICGLSNYSLSIFHLANHAFFKALLFLSAGAIIHSLNDEQDIRKYGGLIKIIPFSYIMVVIGSLALMGIPFLSGFYSKDVIIEIAFSSYLLKGNFIY
jgi:NADH-ubiquinone oxidoreductase chain 5